MTQTDEARCEHCGLTIGEHGIYAYGEAPEWAQEARFFFSTFNVYCPEEATPNLYDPEEDE